MSNDTKYKVICKNNKLINIIVLEVGLKIRAKTKVIQSIG